MNISDLNYLDEELDNNVMAAVHGGVVGGCSCVDTHTTVGSWVSSLTEYVHDKLNGGKCK